MIPWLRAYALALACLLWVGLPLRQRVDRPRTGHPLSTAPGSSPVQEVTTSLPWLLPAATRQAWQAIPGATTSWRFNRATLHLPTVPAAPLAPTFRVVFVADLAPPDHADLLEQFVIEMAALRPDVVLVGGDLTYAETEAWYAAVEAQFLQLERLGIPVLVAAGNHERKGWPLFLRHFGHSPAFRVDIGPLAVLTLDSAHGRDQLTPSQFAWLEDNLNTLDGRTPIIQLHHPVFPAGSAIKGEAGGSGGSLMGFQKAFVRLCQDHSVPAVLSGHWHSDAVFDSAGQLRDDTVDFPGTKFIVTTALGNELRQVTRWPQSYHGYRILDFDRGRLVRYTADEPGSGRRSPIASTPLGVPASRKGTGR